MGINVIKKK